MAVFAHLGGMAFGMLDRLPLPQARAAQPDAIDLRGARHRALDALPADIARRLENVAIVVEDEHAEEPDLLGPLRGRRRVHARQGDDLPPARWRPTSHDPAELEQEIRITVLHELGHYFGLDEGRLEELGYE